MNTNIGFSFTFVTLFAFILLAIIFKLQRNDLFFKLLIVSIAINVISKVFFFDLLKHEDAIYLWYPVWMFFNLTMILFICYLIRNQYFFSKNIMYVALVDFISNSIMAARFIERHYTESSFLHLIYPFAMNGLAIITVAILIVEAFSYQEKSIIHE